jgi:spore germination cell wall hydrolase CwlJ-like protein
VASVIINRHNNGEGSICTITKNKKQFSFNRDPVNFPRSIPLIKKNKAKKYAVVQKVIEKMENGLKPKPDLMWYNNPEFSGDKWHTDQVNEGKFCSISIGNHFFYQK